MTVDALLSFDPTEIYEKVVGLGNKWATAKAQANHLEEMGKILLAKITAELVHDVSATQATATAKKDPRWQIHIDGLKVAQEEFYRADVEYRSAQGWRDDLAYSWRSTKR